jgi:hypothetical protein
MFGVRTRRLVTLNNPKQRRETLIGTKIPDKIQNGYLAVSDAHYVHMNICFKERQVVGCVFSSDGRRPFG